MAKKKVSKKTVDKEVSEPVQESNPVPAIESEQIVIVRGTSMGGTRQFTPAEYAKAFPQK